MMWQKTGGPFFPFCNAHSTQKHVNDDALPLGFRVHTQGTAIPPALNPKTSLEKTSGTSLQSAVQKLRALGK